MKVIIELVSDMYICYRFATANCCQDNANVLNQLNGFQVHNQDEVLTIVQLLIKKGKKLEFFCS